MPSWSQAALPELYAYVINDEKVTAEPWYNIADFKSAGGDSFKSFAKHTNWGQGMVIYCLKFKPLTYGFK